jgi:hypothetical protein
MSTVSGVPVELELPAEHPFDAVGRLVVAGLGARVGLSVDRVEDLQRALETVFEQPAARDTLTVSMTHSPTALSVSVGPLLAGGEEQQDLECVLPTLFGEQAIEESGEGVWITMRFPYAPGMPASL